MVKKNFFSTVFMGKSSFFFELFFFWSKIGRRGLHSTRLGEKRTNLMKVAPSLVFLGFFCLFFRLAAARPANLRIFLGQKKKKKTTLSLWSYGGDLHLEWSGLGDPDII
jgi:hypothetical protein